MARASQWIRRPSMGSRGEGVPRNPPPLSGDARPPALGAGPAPEARPRPALRDEPGSALPWAGAQMAGTQRPCPRKRLWPTAVRPPGRGPARERRPTRPADPSHPGPLPTGPWPASSSRARTRRRNGESWYPLFRASPLAGVSAPPRTRAARAALTGAAVGARTPPGALAVRYGGDELVLVWPDGEAAAVEAPAAQVASDLAGRGPAPVPAPQLRGGRERASGREQEAITRGHKKRR